MARPKPNPTTLRHSLSQYIAWCLYDKDPTEDITWLRGPYMSDATDGTFVDYIEYLVEENIKRKPKWVENGSH